MKKCTRCRAELTTVELLAGRCSHCQADIEYSPIAGEVIPSASNVTVDQEGPLPPAAGDATAPESAAHMPTMELGADLDAPAERPPTVEHGAGMHDTIALGVLSQDTHDVSLPETVAGSGGLTSAGPNSVQDTADVPSRLDNAGRTVDAVGDPTIGSLNRLESAADRPEGTADLARFTAAETLQTWGAAAGNATAQMTIKAAVPPSDQPVATPSVQPRALRPLGFTAAVEQDKVADYDLIDLLGEGGMGVVYNARQASIDRTVAVKMLKTRTAAADEAQEQKFLAEAVVTGELDHPNIVPIYDLGRSADGALFYSMKKVQGTPWMKVLQKKSLAENLDVLLNVADAVAFAHSRGVVHRDLKPENVMLGEFGEVLVLDWGLAIPTSECKKAPTLSGSTGMGGTPCYMAPEMVTGPMDSIGPHSDVYLLGAILFECITGKPPHTGKNALACIAAAGRNEIVATEQTGELVDIAVRAMATRPEERFPSVQSLQEAIRDYQSHSESIALSSRAAKELAAAEGSDVYSEYARALYVFQEAYDLWDKNTEARQGITKAQRAYAAAALRKGDFELGLSVLDKEDESHEKLRAQLSQALSERESRNRRMRNMKRTVFAMAAMVFLAVTVGMLIAWRLKNEAEAQKREAIKQQGIAEARKREADDQRGIAVEKKREAENQKAIADVNREAAEYESYIASIGLAKTRIADNALEEARKILDDFPFHASAWEMRRLRYLCDLSERVFPDAVRIESATATQIESVAVDSTGTRIAIGDQLGTVRVLDAATKELLISQGFPGVRITALGFSPTTSELAIGSDDPNGYLRLWNIAKDQLRTFTGHNQQVADVEFSKDGKRLLTASLDRTARLWNVEDGKSACTLKGHATGVWSAAFSPDEQKIVTASEDTTVRVWNRKEDTDGFAQLLDHEGQVMPFREHTGPVYTAVFSQDGLSVVSADADNRILIWKPAQLRAFDFQALAKGANVPPQPCVELTGHQGPVHRLALLPPNVSPSVGREPNVERQPFIVSASEDNSIKVWSSDGELIKTLRGHSGGVTDIACSFAQPGCLVSASRDGDVRRWDVEDYDEVRVLRGHTAAVLNSEFSPSGDHVVTASADGTARVWSAHDGRLLHTLQEGHPYLTSSVQFIPGTNRLLTAGQDGTVRIWDRSTGAEVLKLVGTGSAAAVAVSHDGAWIATGCESNPTQSGPLTDQRVTLADEGGELKERFARLWDAKTGAELYRFGGHGAHVTVVAFSADSSLLFTGDSKGTFQLWETASQRQVARLRRHTGRITAAEFASDGRTLITASRDHTVAIWPLPRAGDNIGWRVFASSAERTLPHPAAATSLVLVDDQQVLTGCEDGLVRLWNLTSTDRGPIWEWMLPNAANGDEKAKAAISAVDVDLKNSRALAVDSQNNEVFFLDSLTGHQLKRQRLPVPLRAAIFDPHGEGIVTAGGDQARVWNYDQDLDLDIDEQVRFGPHHSVFDASYSHDGDWIVTAGEDGSARIWDAKSGIALRQLGECSAGNLPAHTGPVHSAVFSHDRKQVLTSGADRTIRIWNAESGEVIRVFAGHQDEVTGAFYSPDGKFVLSSSKDGSAAIWEADDATRDPIWLTRGGTNGRQAAVLTAVFSPDGQQVVTGSEDFFIQMWDTATGDEIGEFPRQTAPVTSVAYSPVGDRIVSACRDRKLKVWDAKKQREILALEGHEREVNSVAFSADGRHVVSSGADGVAIIWPGSGAPPPITADPVE